jgi:hypothetical protein
MSTKHPPAARLRRMVCLSRRLLRSLRLLLRLPGLQLPFSTKGLPVNRRIRLAAKGQAGAGTS